MSDLDLPDLPSDEELGIAGESLEDLGDAPEAEAAASPDAAPEGPAVPHGDADDERPAATVPSRPWRGPITVGVLSCLVWASGTSRYLPDPVSLGAPDSAFSSARAMMHVTAMADRPHPTGSPEHVRVREYLVSRLSEAGLEPEVRVGTSFVRRGSALRAATVRNIVARIPGSASTGAVVLTAHYDANRLARGAGDDASGVATVLETLRALRTGPPLRNDLVVLLTDAEELGLLGARAFVDRHPWMEDVAVVLSVEMRGGGGPSIMFETGPENGWIVETMKEGDPRPFANSLSFEVYRRLPNDTDFTPFKEAGVQGLNFAGIGRAHVYHQAYDEPDRLQEATLQHHGLHVLGVVRELGSRDLSVTRAPDQVYLTLPLVGLVVYPRIWVVPISAWLLLMAVLAFLHLRRAGGRITGVLVGVGVTVLAGAVSAAAGWTLFRWVREHHPEYGALQGSAFHEEGWYVAALLFFAVAVTAGLVGLARRRFTLGELSLGAVGVPLVLALVVTFAAPMAAMNLQWPVLAGLAAASVTVGRGPGERPGTLGWILMLLLAAPVLAILVPVLELVWISMSFAFAAPLGALMVVAIVLLVPLVDAVGEPNRWWVPVSGLLLAGVLVGLGVGRAEPSAERPAPSTLLYTLDRESGTARWATREGTGLAWARNRTGFTDLAPDTGDVLEPFGLGHYLMATAPVVDIPPPRVSVARVGAESGDTLRVTVRSSVGAELVDVRLPEEGGLALTAVDGRSVASARDDASVPLRSVGHWGVPQGEEGVVFDLEVGPERDGLALDVVEHHLRPGELLGRHPFLRPPGLAPDASALSDRAVVRTRVPLVPGVRLGPDSVAVPPADSLPSLRPDSAGAADESVGTPPPDSGGVTRPPR